MMTVQLLINDLQALMEEHGNVPVVVAEYFTSAAGEHEELYHLDGVKYRESPEGEWPTRHEIVLF